jgi:4-hydroxythreonine-4-phosphate dehydrogenase
MNRAGSDKKIKIGITIGDVNGIGPEVIIRTFLDPMMTELFTPVIYGSGKAISYYKKVIGKDDFNFVNVRTAAEAGFNKVNVIQCWNEELRIEPGSGTVASSRCAMLALERAMEDLSGGSIQAMVTAPIDKSKMSAAGFKYAGHTEFLAVGGNAEALMIMVHEDLRVALVTGHMALSKVSESISKESILTKLHILNQSLQLDFTIRKPKIAVLGLNPHSGDNGKFGSEEAEIILPAINAGNEKNILCYGPFPADGFFAAQKYRDYDGVLAMYHDQGLIPFKTISQLNGVNYTAGLPFVRTSPDHGVGFDIAGQNQASESSFRQAVYLANDIYEARKSNKEFAKNPLRKLSQDFDQREDE